MTNTLELLLTLITTTTLNTVPDLCDVVDTATGVPLHCDPHPDGAPIYDGNVCCTNGTCKPATSRCEADSVFYCELGKRRTDGGVSCYFEVPYVCDVYPCDPGYGVPPLEEPMCCNAGICWHYTIGSNGCELDDIMWCQSGVSNPDGTVTCLDDE